MYKSAFIIFLLLSFSKEKNIKNFTNKITLSESFIDNNKDVEEYIKSGIKEYIILFVKLISHAKEYEEIKMLILKSFNIKKNSFLNFLKKEKLDIIFDNISLNLLVNYKEILQHLEFDDLKVHEEIFDSSGNLKEQINCTFYTSTSFGFVIKFHITCNITKIENDYKMKIYINDISYGDDFLLKKIYETMNNSEDFYSNLKKESKVLLERMYRKIKQINENYSYEESNYE